MRSAVLSRPDAALLLLVVALGSMVAWQETGEELPAATIATPAGQRQTSPAPVPAVRAIAFPNRSEFQEIAARPPFRASRRPPEALVPKPIPVSPPPRPVAPAPPPALTLLGTLAGPGGTIAILRSPAAPTAQAASAGDEVAGWKIIDVFPDRVRVTAGAAEQELAFPANAAAAAIRKSTTSAIPSIPSATARAR